MNCGRDWKNEVANTSCFLFKGGRAFQGLGEEQICLGEAPVEVDAHPRRREPADVLQVSGHCARRSTIRGDVLDMFNQKEAFE